MSTTITRRHILKLAGGSALGFFFTPMPWKLLDDLSIWTQNWDLIPPLPRGPVTTAMTACTLCSRGCPVQASLVNGIPFGLAGQSDGLCPYGLTGHQLLYHPSRLRAASARVTPEGSLQQADADAMIDELAAIMKGADRNGGIAYVTSRPESMPADVAARLLRDIPGSTVCTPPCWDGRFFDAARMLLPEGHAPVGVDLGRVKTILSVHAPVLEGWGASHDLLAAIRDRRRSIGIIEAAPVRSAPGIFGASWLQIAPGTERACILAITRMLIDEFGIRAGGWAGPLMSAPIDALVSQTRLPEQKLRDAASALGSARPSLVIASDAADRSLLRAAWQLNLLLGAFGPDGCVVSRRPAAASGPYRMQDLEDLPDASLRMVFIDPSVTATGLPPDLLRKKLTGPDAVVVRLGAFADPLALASTHLLRTALPYERLSDVRSHPASAMSFLGLSIPLHPPSETAATPAEILRSIADRAGLKQAAGVPANETAMLHELVDRIHRTGRGEVKTPSGKHLARANAVSSGELWESLMAGNRWTDRSSARALPDTHRCMLDEAMLKVLQGPAAREVRDHLTAVIEGIEAAATFTVVSPSLSKMYQESGLKPRSTRVLVHPETAHARGLSEHEDAVFLAGETEIRARVAFRKDIPPGVAVFGIAPFGLPDESIADRPGIQRLTAQQPDVPQIIGDFLT